MSLVESLQKVLSFGDRETIAYNVILGAIIGGIGVGFSRVLFKDDYSIIIETLIGTIVLFNKSSNPLLRTIGFLLATDGLNSFSNKVFSASSNKESSTIDSMPFECLSAIPVQINGTTGYAGCSYFTIPEECAEYYEAFAKYQAIQHINSEFGNT